MVVGAVFGLSIPISRVAVAHAPNPFGIALWVNGLGAVIGLSVALYRKSLPRLTAANIQFFVLWGIFGTLFGEVVLFTVASRLEASLIAIVVVAEGFIVFAFAAAIGLEQANSRRLAGFATGATGLALVVFTIHQLDADMPLMWGVLALVVPVSYAFRTLLVTTRLPDDMDLYGAVGYRCIAGAIFVLPIAWLTGDFVPLPTIDATGNHALLFAVSSLAIITAAGTVLRAILIKTTGAVFSSQSSLVATLAGVGWSIVLLGERLPATGWISLILMLYGVYLVGPKEEAEADRRFLHSPDVEL
jgi:drug/metabolite transporter (DMT)-like permease